MIRVGDQKPKLFFVPAHNDMSHFTPSHYATNDFYYMSLMEYMEKLQFDQFDMNPNLPKSEIDLILKTIREGNEFDSFMNPWAYEMNRLIKRANGQVWQFNTVSSDLTDYVRQIVILGEKRMKRWSFFDAHVVLPVLKFTAKVLNGLRKSKTEKEWANWQVFLNKVHKKSS